MDDKIEKLIDAFLSKRWELLGSVDIIPDWWFSDILHLSSKWRSIDTNIHLTLLTNPQSTGQKNSMVYWYLDKGS